MKGTILVTGGTGYIGSHTTVELIQAGYQVISIDNLSNSNIEVLDGIEAITGIRPTFYEIDCNDEAAIERVFAAHPSIQGVIHFAASKAVGESVQKPLLYYKNNLLSLIVLLEAMQRHGTKGIVFSSSCTVYGQPELLPVTEEAPPSLPTAIPSRSTRRSSMMWSMQVPPTRSSAYATSTPSGHIPPPSSASSPMVYLRTSSPT